MVAVMVVTAAEAEAAVEAEEAEAQATIQCFQRQPESKLIHRASCASCTATLG